jgi:hypothetical protein
MKRRYIVFISVAVVLLLTFALVRLTAIPIHAFDQSWDPYHLVAVDAKIKRMAIRAQFDGYVCGMRSFGRMRLRFDGASRHGSDYDLYFIPEDWSDMLVVYRFRADGKPLWKTCTMVEAAVGALGSDLTRRWSERLAAVVPCVL